jgi:hypothetical protein
MNILEPACLLRPFTMQARPVTVSLAVVLLTSCVTSATLRSDEDRALYDRSLLSRYWSLLQSSYTCQ